jgi:hypothetical protein
VPPLPSIGLPLPPIGLPLPLLGLPPAGTPTTSPPRRAPKAPRDRRGRHVHGPSVVYFVSPYGWAAPAGAAAPGATSPAPDPAELDVTSAPTGILRLDLHPRDIGDVFVDGFFAGALADVGADVALEAGPHQVEIRAAGFEPLFVKVRIEKNRAITYRGHLLPEPAVATPEPAAPDVGASPVVRKPFYFIPGCYLGDVPPKDAGLPASCDPSRATIYKP